MERRLHRLGDHLPVNALGLRLGENTLYTFTGGADGGNPLRLVTDGRNLYGVNIGGGCSGPNCPHGIQGAGASTVFMLSPSNGNWTHTVIRDFEGLYDAGITIDTAGSLYVAVDCGGLYSNGYVFKLTPSGGTRIYTDLYDFQGGNNGSWPWAVSVDQQGNVFGTTTNENV